MATNNRESPRNSTSPELTVEEAALRFSSGAENLLGAAYSKNQEASLTDGRRYQEFSDDAGNRFREFTDKKFSGGSLTIQAMSPIRESWNMQYSARIDQNGSSVVNEWSVDNPTIRVKRLHSDGNYWPASTTAKGLSGGADVFMAYAEGLQSGDEQAGRHPEQQKPIDKQKTLKKFVATVALGGVLLSGAAALHYKNEAHKVKDDTETSFSVDTIDPYAKPNAETVEVDPGDVIHGTTIYFPQDQQPHR